jgi:hypothetical protein
MPLSDKEQAEQLYQFYANRGQGGPTPDPATLGDPADYNGLSWVVGMLQAGTDPELVYRHIPDPMIRAMANAGTGGQAPATPPPDPTDVEVPALPQAARVDPALGVGASPWLDAYADFSRLWSPRAYEGFHDVCALWLLSTIGARRVRAHLGGQRFTNLYIALVARTSLFAKSTTAKIAIDTLRAAGLSWLLAADDCTPQKFVSDLVRGLPGDYAQLSPELQERARLRAAFPAQRGWFFEEFGQKLAAILAAGGAMADFRGLLRALDDCPQRYEYGSIGRGTDLVLEPYLALLGNMTPADMRQGARKNDAMWGDGFWARFAFVTPPPGTNRKRGRFPEGERVIPDALIRPLVEWHQRLGIPDVQVAKEVGDDGKPTGRLEAEVGAQPVTLPCEIADDVQEAFYAYHDGLCDLIEDSPTPDLDGNYSRFAEKALRVAMLLGSLDNGGRVEMPQWARAQDLAEQWRVGLHSLYFQVNQDDQTEEEAKEERVMQVVERLGGCTPNEARRYLRGMSNREVAAILDSLSLAGAIQRAQDATHKGTYRYEVVP